MSILPKIATLFVVSLHCIITSHPLRLRGLQRVRDFGNKEGLQVFKKI